MKVILVCRENHGSQFRTVFPAIHPYMLPIVNKPIVEYFIDFFSLQKVSEIRVVNPDHSVEEYLENGSRWGMAISYGFIKESDDIKAIMNKNSLFVPENNESILVLDGYFFLESAITENIPAFFEFSKSYRYADGEISITFLDKKNGLDNLTECPSDLQKNLLRRINRLSTIHDYFMLGMKILGEKNTDYVLPGYSNEKNIFIGQDVEISKTTQFKLPVMLGNGVSLKSGTSIGPCTIIGSQVIIDRNTSISNSIILDGSYLGEELEFKNRIVYRNRLIDPETGTILQISDGYIISSLQKNMIQTVTKRIFDFCGAGILLLLGLPFFIVFGLPSFLFGFVEIQKTDMIKNKTGEICFVRRFFPATKNFFGKLFFIFSLDKYLRYISVLSGNLFLTGNRPYRERPHSFEVIDAMAVYFPAVWNWSDCSREIKNESEYEIDDLYYSANPVGLGIIIICKGIFLRLSGYGRWGY